VSWWLALAALENKNEGLMKQPVQTRRGSPAVLTAVVSARQNFRGECAGWHSFGSWWPFEQCFARGHWNRLGR